MKKPRTSSLDQRIAAAHLAVELEYFGLGGEVPELRLDFAPKPDDPDFEVKKNGPYLWWWGVDHAGYVIPDRKFLFPLPAGFEAYILPRNIFHVLFVGRYVDLPEPPQKCCLQPRKGFEKNELVVSWTSSWYPGADGCMLRCVSPLVFQCVCQPHGLVRPAPFCLPGGLQAVHAHSRELYRLDLMKEHQTEPRYPVWEKMGSGEDWFYERIIKPHQVPEVPFGFVS